MKKALPIMLLLSVLFTSCFVNRVTVGYGGPVGETMRSRTFSKVKQRYVLFGLIRLNEVAPQMPPSGVSYEIKSSFNIIDGFLTLVTGGIYGQRTVKILVDKNVENEVKQQQKSK